MENDPSTSDGFAARTGLPTKGTPLTEDRTTDRVEDLKELHHLCQQGMLYEVEAWILDGRPLQIAPGVKVRGHYSALEIALDTGQHSLCRLLLKSGYRIDLEKHYPLDTALSMRRWDLFDLLLEYGADLHRVDLETLFDTYRSDLFERFFTAGVDLARGSAMATALAYHTGNKPLLGFVKRHREQNSGFQRQLDMALGHHVSKKNEKGIQLCLWAGADPHARVPDLEYGSYDDPEEECGTAIDTVVFGGNLQLLQRFKPDPRRVSFDDLYESASQYEVIEYLATIRPPRDLTRIIRHLSRLAGSTWDFYQGWKDSLLAVLRHGRRWKHAEEKALAEIRRNLQHAKDWELKDVLRALANQEVCSPEIFQELTRTPTMQHRMRALGLVKPVVKPVSELTKLRSEVERLLRRYDRQKLYEEVWSKPVLEVAKSYGVSGVYLARICGALHVPVPPRGYWAKLRNGKAVRRLPLRPLPKGYVGSEWAR